MRRDRSLGAARAPRALLTFAIVIFAFSCKGGDGGAPGTYIEGVWVLSASYLAPTPYLMCADTSRLRASTSGMTFSFTGARVGSCQLPAGAAMTTDTQVATQTGQIGAEQSVSFQLANCMYTGAATPGGLGMSGSVQCTVATPSGAEAATGTWQAIRHDSTSPVITGFVPPGAYYRGDTFTVTALASGDDQLQYLGDSVYFDWAYSTQCPTRPPSLRDSVPVGGTSAEASFQIVVPVCTGVIFITYFSRDVKGERLESYQSRVDVTGAVSQITGTLDDTVHTLGDTMRIVIGATNPRGLGWVGYRWTDVNSSGQDSIAASGTSVTDTFKLRIPPNGQDGAPLSVIAFARYRLGDETDQPLGSVRTTDAIRLPISRLGIAGTPSEMAYARGSDRLYYTDASTAGVREVTLTPLAVGRAFATGATSYALDLSISDDSLLVALRGQMTLAVVELGAGTISTVAITPPDDFNIYEARGVREMASGRTMVLVASGGGGDIIELDLATNTQSIRESWDGYGILARLPDRSRMFLMSLGSPTHAQLYLSGTDTFGAIVSGVVAGSPIWGSINGDSASTSWLVGTQLLTVDLVPTRTFSGLYTQPFSASTLSSDGARAYVQRYDGVDEFDAATGTFLRAIWMPSQPTFLRVLPGHRLLALCGATLVVVALQ